ncbi:MAG: hypothetical protein ACYTED_09420 [Planctomycetota bacterium]
MRRTTATVLGLLLACCGGSGGGGPPPTVNTVDVAVDASAVAGTLRQLWRDHYDLSYSHMAYAGEPGFAALVSSLQPRSWRCSVGRWEVGYPPPPGGDSLDPAALATVEREFYRGGNTLPEADDPLNYDFTYLDAQLADLVAQGATPFLCFDYMPFTLSSEQDPSNAHNFNLSRPGVPYSQYSFSKGIRTAPPADPAVYARVVRNTIRHVRGLFAGSTDFGVAYIEIGNESDLIDGTGTPFMLFWTGDRAQWIAMYDAIAAAVDADPAITGLVRLGGGSFAFPPFEPAPGFLRDFLADVAFNGTRLDFVSFHSYSDDPDDHLNRFLNLDAITTGLGLAPERIDGEWGRTLGGADPVYDRIEHGLFRAKVLILMQVFGITRAHEALLRDPFPGSNQPGLVRTGPPAHKPVSDCYRALGMLDATPEALPLTTSGNTYAMAGRDAAGTKVIVVVVVDEPALASETRVDLTVSGLPWGAGGYELRRHRVTAQSSAAGTGVELVDTQALSGATLTSSVQVPLGGQGLFVWELTRL